MYIITTTTTYTSKFEWLDERDFVLFHQFQLPNPLKSLDRNGIYRIENTGTKRIYAWARARWAPTIVIHGVMGPLEMAENKCVTGVIHLYKMEL